MRLPAVSFVNKLWAAALAALLTFTLVPASAFAEGEGDAVDASAEELREVSAEQVDEGSGVAPMLASGLVGNPSSFVSADVALDGEPIVGSFTVDGLTFAVTEGSDVELVGVSPDWQQVADSQEGDGSPVAPMLASGSDGLAADSSALAVSESVTYEGIDYAVTSIGAYAFYLSGVTSVELPASIAQVDDRAFRSSDVASVTVADGNAIYSSFDGALYDADQSSLLLIPEGKQGTVLLPKTAESAAPSVFSHCPLVMQVSVEEGSAAFASENGLLYTSDLTTLLRVPAGATDIAIHDGCTTIAAGAMEACASLATITAPASVTSISPDVFTSVPTVSLPAVAAVADDPGASTGATEESSEQSDSTPVSNSASTQLTAMVALSATDDDLPKVDPSTIIAATAKEKDPSWESLGLQTATQSERAVADAVPSFSMTINPNGGTITNSNPSSETKSTLRLTAYFNWAVRMSGITSYRAATQTGTYYFRISATRAGYTFTGWSVAYDGKTQVVNQDGQTISGTTAMTATPSWKANSYAIEYRNRADSATFSTDNGFVYDTSRNLAAKPTSGLSVGYTAVGWATSKDQSSADYDFGSSQKNLTTSGTKKLYLAERPNTYTITFDSAGGTEASSISAVYDQEIELPAPTRQGYAFSGWLDGVTGTTYGAGKAKNLTAADKGTVKLIAQWAPVISADVPSAVTARVDVLGIEEQEEAAAYIESRCGEPLQVTEVAFEPLAGASELFGADASQVSLEAYAGSAADPVFSLPLHQASYLMDTVAFRAFRMAAYGTRVPISYRFVIPDELLLSLVETEKPVCTVAYTVALA